MKILGHSRVIAALSNIRDLPRQINSKAISQNLRSPILQSLQHLRGTKKDAYSGFRASRMSINGADAQRKNIFGDKKIVSNFWQKSSNVSDQKRDALIEKANDFLRRLDHVENVADRSINATLIKLKNHSRGMRTEQQYEVEDLSGKINKTIESTRSKIQEVMQENNLLPYRKATLQKTGLSQNKYDEIIRDINNIRKDFQSSINSAKSRLDELNKV
ncbi:MULTISPECIES: hypothetical protein [Burkholderiaceae]|uniref:hypothetical protein n=1 Tax=Burkholderiaceae TaxID=119060 RepID=UPI00096067DA|nr:MULTISPECIES: hypothetical protein [Burkholderiaceae]SIT71736.1 hypothetical protein SAMN04487769_1935 [Burkholderia sp. b14]